jgi:hypothetical protein
MLYSISIKKLYDGGKINFIQDHFSKKKKFWTEFWTIILIAAVILSLLFLLAISRL